MVTTESTRQECAALGVRRVSLRTALSEYVCKSVQLIQFTTVTDPLQSVLRFAQAAATAIQLASNAFTMLLVPRLALLIISATLFLSCV